MTSILAGVTTSLVYVESAQVFCYNEVYTKITWGRFPMTLRERLKQEIDSLNESQLSSIAEFMASIKAQAQQLVQRTPFWQRATPAERARDFKEWAAGLPKIGLSLSDEAFDRGTIYE
jgi:hypothetical protein